MLVQTFPSVDDCRLQGKSQSAVARAFVREETLASFTLQDYYASSCFVYESQRLHDTCSVAS